LKPLVNRPLRRCRSLLAMGQRCREMSSENGKAAAGEKGRYLPAAVSRSCARDTAITFDIGRCSKAGKGARAKVFA
jgi:hypothetical protein